MKIHRPALFLLLTNNLSSGVSQEPPACIAFSSFEFEFDGECSYEEVLEAFRPIFEDPINSGKDCTNTAEQELQVLLKAKDSEEAKTALHAICNDAFQSYPNVFNFADIAKKGGNFEQLFYNGGTDWNEEYQTEYPTDAAGNPTNVLKADANRVKLIYNTEAQYGLIEHPDSLTNFDQCSTNAVMCCWPKDRQANDHNGNCGTPYDTACIDKDPADNTDLCYVEMEKGQLSTGFNTSGIQMFPGDDGSRNTKPSTDYAEGQIHCHGFAWSEDETDKSAVYKGNNLFYISMYDHMLQRGYVKNIPGAPMCACTDQMPVVTRSDCTEIDVEESFKFTYTSGAFAAELTDIDIDFNACQGINQNGHPQINDLWSYMNQLFLEGKVGPEKLADLNEVLVGTHHRACDRATDKMMYTKKALSTGYEHDESMWTIVAGREGLDYTGNNYWHTYGPVAVEDLLRASKNRILRRVCADCVPQLQDIFYKRITDIPQGIPDYSLFKRIKDHRRDDDNYNKWNVDFELYSTYEDAVNGENAWPCDTFGGYRYDQGFPGDCSQVGRIEDQDTMFDHKYGKQNVGFYVEKSEDFQYTKLDSTIIGNVPFDGATYENPDENRIYMTASGYDMWNQVDHINFLWEEYTGDVELIVNVAAVESTRVHTKSGIMVRGSLEQNSAYYGVMKTGDSGVRTQVRDRNNGWTYSSGEDRNDKSSSWLRLLKKGNMYHGYKSDDGLDWKLIDSKKLDNIVGEKFYIGLFHSGREWYRVNEVVFEDYNHMVYSWPSASPTTTPAPSIVPDSIDIPEGIKEGYSTEAGDKIEMGAYGHDIWGSNDGFHFLSYKKSGDFTVTAFVESLDYKNSWSKAGVMIRDHLGDRSKNVFTCLTGVNGMMGQWRSSESAGSNARGYTYNSRTASGWVRIAKVGNEYSTYKSADGENWTFIFTETIVMDRSDTVEVGLALTSHTNSAMSKAVFRYLTIEDAPQLAR